MTAGAPVDSKPEVKLAAGFASATREQWLKLVDKAIKGADFEKKLVSKTADGIRIEPIYVRDGKTEEVSLPGSAPFTRGTHAQVAGLGWEIRQTIAEADPATANTQILTELEGGANGITLEIEAPGQLGLRVSGAGGFAKALKGVDLEMAPVELRAGLGGLTAARQLLDALPALGAKPATARAVPRRRPDRLAGTVGAAARAHRGVARWRPRSSPRGLGLPRPASARFAPTAPFIMRPARPRAMSSRRWRPRSSPICAPSRLPAFLLPRPWGTFHSRFLPTPSSLPPSPSCAPRAS